MNTSNYISRIINYSIYALIFIFSIFSIFFTILYLLTERVPSDSFWGSQITIGVTAGTLMAVIGYIMFLKFDKWANSMSYIVGKTLLKGNILTLFMISLAAGVLEELYTRGLYLLLYNMVFHRITYTFAIIITIVNVMWALHHVYHNMKELNIRPKFVLERSMPHVTVIFISGFIFTYMAIVLNSILAPIIGHFILDFLFGILYRNHYRTAKH